MTVTSLQGGWSLEEITQEPVLWAATLNMAVAATHLGNCPAAACYLLRAFSEFPALMTPEALEWLRIAAKKISLGEDSETALKLKLTGKARSFDLQFIEIDGEWTIDFSGDSALRNVFLANEIHDLLAKGWNLTRNEATTGSSACEIMAEKYRNKFSLSAAQYYRIYREYYPAK